MLLAAGCPQLRLRLGLFLFFVLLGGPELLSRRGEVGGDRRDIGDQPIERGSEAKILANGLLLPVRPDVLDQTVCVLAGALRLLAQVRVHVVVRDRDRGLLCKRFKRELACDRHCRLEDHLALDVLRVRSARLDVGLERYAAALERPGKAIQKVGGARLHERQGGLDIRCLDELVDGCGAERGVDLDVELLSQGCLDARAELGKRVELARRASELVVERQQHLLVHVAQRHLDRARAAVCPLVGHLRRLTRRRSEEHLLELRREPTGPELDHGVPLRLALRIDDVDHDGVALASRAPFRRSELCDRLAQEPRAPHRPTPAGPRPRAGRPRASSSRRYPGAVGPPRSPRTSRARRPCSAARTRTAGRLSAERGFAPPRSRTSRRCDCRRPPSRSAPCQGARRAPARESSPCGSRGA